MHYHESPPHYHSYYSVNTVLQTELHVLPQEATAAICKHMVNSSLWIPMFLDEWLSIDLCFIYVRIPKVSLAL